MTKTTFPTPRQFLLSIPLYSEIVFAGEQIWNIIDLLYFDGTYDSFCAKCERDSTFQVIPPIRPQGLTRNLNKEALYKSEGITPDLPSLNDDIYRVHATCTRKKNHSQDFLFFIDRKIVKDETGKPHIESIIQKVGQQPSFSDLHIAKIKKYTHVLEKTQLRELNRAIGLASHDVGVGSYVYLRRVFEALIEEAHAVATTESGWDENTYLQSRMAEKIGLLKNHLPPFLVEHPKMYSLLSKGVHELSEEECLSHFETLRIAIELILDEKQERKEREKKVREAKAALGKAFGETTA